ncbi:MAG TPA: hypothetical protein VJQ25_13530, partial [Nitrospira sp.]|nr:hypothetical protein [Nitrospira sp.]
EDELNHAGYFYVGCGKRCKHIVIILFPSLEDGGNRNIIIYGARGGVAVTSQFREQDQRP